MKNMQYNFEILLERIVDSLNISDLRKIHDLLFQIQESVICVGNGGSSVVSEFANVLFNSYNGCATKTLDPRDLLYHNNNAYKNVFISSYSGENYGVETAFKNNCTKYLFSTKDLDSKRIRSITYKSDLLKEKSFISLGATMMPISILLSYYKEGTVQEIIEKVYNKCNNLEFDDINSNNFDCLSGFESSVATKFIESTFVEAGLGNVIVHNRYDFCHGRTTLPYHDQNRTLIFFKVDDSDLTKLELECAKELYEKIIILESDYKDPILNNFDLTMQAMFLAKKIAEEKSKDLSAVEYSPVVKKLYYFKGTM
jgi:hypothetical protein